MAKGWRKFSRVKVMAAIKGSGGLKSVICQRLGCDRQTLENYFKDSEELREAYQREVDDLGDVVEAKIIEAIRSGSETMAIFYAKTKLKSRGYVERQEIDPMKPIVVVIDQDDAKA